MPLEEPYTPNAPMTHSTSMAPPGGTWWDQAEASHVYANTPYQNRGALPMLGPGSAPSPMPAAGTTQYDWWAQAQLGPPATSTPGSRPLLPDMFGNIYRGVEAMYGPQLAQEQARLGQEQMFNALRQQGFNDQEAAMRAKHAADLGLLGNQRADNAILLQALERQPDYLNKLRSLDLTDLNLQSDRALRQNKSDYTRRGAVFTPGFGRDEFDIQSGRWIGTERINTRTNEELAQVGDRRKQLQNQAKSYGLQENQLRAALQQGLSALNLDRAMSVGDLMDIADSPTGRQIMDEAINLWMQSMATGVLPQFPSMGSNSGVNNSQLTSRTGPR